MTRPHRTPAVQNRSLGPENPKSVTSRSVTWRCLNNVCRQWCCDTRTVTRMRHHHANNFRGQKLNTFSQTFRAPPGYPSKIPEYIPPKKFDFPDFEGHTELFGPHPFKWKTPYPSRKYPDSRVWVCALFSCLKFGAVQFELHRTSRWHCAIRATRS